MRASPPLPGRLIPHQFFSSLALLVVAGASAHLYMHYADDNLVLTPLFLGPIIFCSWSCKRVWAFALTFFAITLLYFATRDLTHTPFALWTTMVSQFLTYQMVAMLVTSLRIRIERERSLAREDSLTGLANIRAFNEAAARAVARMRRVESRTSVIYLDVDHFKTVNDELGHREGDEVLKVIALALRSCSRIVDTPARIGGDEFALLLPQTDEAGAGVVAMRFMNELREQTKGKVTCSVGCATFRTPPADGDEMLKEADNAMYLAKSRGRNRIAYVVDKPFLSNGGTPTTYMRSES
jgi:diguanylate cyclase (GGDEF)-like protein